MGNLDGNNIRFLGSTFHFNLRSRRLMESIFDKGSNFLSSAKFDV